jgi:hypothetical protein
MRVGGNIGDRHLVVRDAEPFVIYSCANGCDVAFGKSRDLIDRMRRFEFEKIIPDSITQFVDIHHAIHFQIRATLKLLPLASIIWRFIFIRHDDCFEICGCVLLRLAAFPFIFGLSFLVEFALSFLK